MHENRAKIISLVPSWTETLLRAGASVAGRTRFCIHPQDAVREIPAVGGTKGFRIEEILALGPDLVILDREENRREMAEELGKNGIELLVSHVTDVASAADFLEQLGTRLGGGAGQALAQLGMRYRALPPRLSREDFWRAVCLQQNASPEWENIDYVIWENPYMAVGRETFIADVLRRFGIELTRGEKYPQLTDEELKARYGLYSSEPFPFARRFSRLTADGYRGALVDGEKISWYGIRNLEFMESCVESV